MHPHDAHGPCPVVRQAAPRPTLLLSITRLTQLRPACRAGAEAAGQQRWSQPPGWVGLFLK